MYGALDISTSGMIAQRTRLETISANLANKDSILDATGKVNPYRARTVYFAPGDPSARTPEGQRMGVHIARIGINRSPLDEHWDPDSPFAYKSGPRAGYVPESNVKPVIEQINAIDASRAYEANIAAAEATKAMMAQALRLIA
jgi:flagellar basal-body rod protein FlgC